MHKILLGVSLALALLLNTCQGLYDAKSPVVRLTKDNFSKLVLNSDELWFVEFYAPWCGHCKKLEPEWNEVASKLKGQVKVAKVDATQESELAEKFKIKGYPTIKIF